MASVTPGSAEVKASTESMLVRVLGAREQFSVAATELLSAVDELLSATGCADPTRAIAGFAMKSKASAAADLELDGGGS